MGGHGAALLVRRVKSQPNPDSAVRPHLVPSAPDLDHPDWRLRRKPSLPSPTKQEHKQESSHCNVAFHRKSRSLGDYDNRRKLSVPGRALEATAAKAVTQEVTKAKVEDEQPAVDAWADVGDAHARGAACPCSYEEIQALILSRQAQANAEEACALQELVNYLQRMQDSVTDDVEVLCRGVATHCAGAAAASSLSELQDHLNELVQLSGPEVSCAWSTVKVGLGVASVLSGNLIIGSCMVALAVGSLGTSIIWKVHRDNQRSASSLKGKHAEAHAEHACNDGHDYVNDSSEHKEEQRDPHVHLEKSFNDNSECDDGVYCDAWSG
ncbi:hypothetical protein Emed_003856 [Eimeria media]